MEFCEKLQELRKNRGLTQEELAEQLYVSRTAISKWESGRGYPSIDSLKAIAKYFSVSVDDLLSSDTVLAIAEEDRKRSEKHSRTLVFGLLDCSAGLLLFLPFFCIRSNNYPQAVSLLSLVPAAPYTKPLFLPCADGRALDALHTDGLAGSGSNRNCIWICHFGTGAAHSAEKPSQGRS